MFIEGNGQTTCEPQCKGKRQATEIDSCKSLKLKYSCSSGTAHTRTETFQKQKHTHTHRQLQNGHNTCVSDYLSVTVGYTKNKECGPCDCCNTLVSENSTRGLATFGARCNLQRIICMVVTATAFHVHTRTFIIQPSNCRCVPQLPRCGSVGLTKVHRVHTARPAG